MYSYEKEINSINEYIDFIKKYKSEKSCELWYRGHRDNHWILDSSIFLRVCETFSVNKDL